MAAIEEMVRCFFMTPVWTLSIEKMSAQERFKFRYKILKTDMILKDVRCVSSFDMFTFHSSLGISLLLGL